MIYFLLGTVAAAAFFIPTAKNVILEKCAV
jgi:hypothetical protein